LLPFFYFFLEHFSPTKKINIVHFQIIDIIKILFRRENLSQIDRLQPFAGIYKQNDGNTFVILIKNNSLCLKTNDIKEEKLIARGDGLYEVENTNAKIKFHLGPNGKANSITFYLKDRQTVASREVAILKEASLFEKFKELGIAAVVFLALIGVFFISYVPMKKACLSGANPTLCRLASLSARMMGKLDESKRLSQQESRAKYGQINEEIKSQCANGEQSSCLELAKGLTRLGSVDRAEEILKKSCYEQRYGDSCQFWRDIALEKEEYQKVEEIMNHSCDIGIAIGCYELAWKYKKADSLEKAIPFFDKACELGEEKSCYELGMHHLKFNRERSLTYLNESCKGYHRQACDLKEKVEKFFTHKQECNRDNSPRSCFLIASFEQDYGDRSKAMDGYRKACKMGYQLACNIVKREDKVRDLREKGEKIETI